MNLLGPLSPTDGCRSCSQPVAKIILSALTCLLFPVASYLPSLLRTCAILLPRYSSPLYLAAKKRSNFPRSTTYALFSLPAISAIAPLADIKCAPFTLLSVYSPSPTPRRFSPAMLNSPAHSMGSPTLLLFSNTAVFLPDSSSSEAHIRPEGPAPTIITSYLPVIPYHSGHCYHHHRYSSIQS